MFRNKETGKYTQLIGVGWHTRIHIKHLRRRVFSCKRLPQTSWGCHPPPPPLHLLFLCQLSSKTCNNEMLDEMKALVLRPPLFLSSGKYHPNKWPTLLRGTSLAVLISHLYAWGMLLNCYKRTLQYSQCNTSTIWSKRSLNEFTLQMWASYLHTITYWCTFSHIKNPWGKENVHHKEFGFL